MNLIEAIQELDNLPEAATIYAQKIEGRWQAESPVLIYDSENQDPNQDEAGWGYLLEVDLAREAIAVYKEWRNKSEITDDEKLRAIIFYAENDAYLSAEDESDWRA